MEAFELRLWDGRLGRWLTVDPYHEFHSPYVGMGNNPISLVDPNGGMTDGGGDPPGFFARLWNKITGNTGNTAGEEDEAYSINLDEVELVLERKAKTAAQHVTLFSLSALNAWSSNQVLGAGRLPSNKFSGTSFDTTFRVAQMFGDVASIGSGGGEFIAGSGMVVGGVAGAPESAGLTLAVSVEGAAVAGHGLTVGGTATGNLVRGIADFMSQNNHSSSGGGGLDKLYSGKTAEEIISKYRKASVREVFPGELLTSTWEEIVAGANKGLKKYKTAKKLLTDGRFRK